MPCDLFGDVVSPRTSVGGRKWYTVPLSLVAHVAIILPLVLAPLLATDMLPAVHEYVVYVDPVVPPPPPPPPPSRVIDTDRRPQPNPEAAPSEAPDTISPEPEIPSVVPEPSAVGVPGGLPGGGILIAEPPPSPPPPAKQEPVRPGGKIKPPVRLRGAAPVYPAIAQQARVEGTVILEATIEVDGSVRYVKVLRSIPLLDQAALDAVRQWQYSATLLNGVPVPVVMTVTVTFTLNREWS
jgi:protein TonB